jgi:hypothetical protein
MANVYAADEEAARRVCKGLHMIDHVSDASYRDVFGAVATSHLISLHSQSNWCFLVSTLIKMRLSTVLSAALSFASLVSFVSGAEIVLEEPGMIIFYVFQVFTA